MATMDMIKLYGGEPANFLDIGGSSSPQKVIDAMNILLNDKNVTAVMINIFGGITRCDDVAKGLIKAMGSDKYRYSNCGSFVRGQMLPKASKYSNKPTYQQ